MNNKHSYSTNQERKIHAMMTEDKEVNIIAGCKIYTSGVQGKEWLYSDLEGMLVFILDYQNKARYLTVYDSFSFEVLFQYELYTDFSCHYLKLAPDFRCFEIEGGFIGLQFDLVKEATELDFMLKKIEGFLLDSLFDSRPVAKHYEDIESKMRKYTKVIKNSLSMESNYDETYAEDGIEINKPRSFEILNNISFNRETKQFEIGEISEELKIVFIEAGIRKKDLIHDVNFAFMMFKKIILGVDDNKDLLNNEYLHKEYPQPEDVPFKKNDTIQISKDTTEKSNEMIDNNHNGGMIDNTSQVNKSVSQSHIVNNSNMPTSVIRQDNLQQNEKSSQIENNKGVRNTIQETNKNQTQIENSINKKIVAKIKPSINSKIAPPKKFYSKGVKPHEGISNSKMIIPELKSINNNPHQIAKKPIEKPNNIIQPPITKPSVSIKPNPIQPVFKQEKPATKDINNETKQQNNNITPPSIPTPPQVPSSDIPLPPPFLGLVFIPPVTTVLSFY